jgi:arabinosaccharide transport system substrate-binding protein
MFHLGKPILILAILAVAAGMAIISRPAPRAADMTVWVFTDEEATAFRQELTDSYQRQIGKTVAVDLIASRALDARLLSLFMSAHRATTVPDLVEIDLSSIGKYFRPPVDDIGLLPLNDFLSHSGQLQQIVPSRLVPWSKHGVIFGVPRDVHPVTLVYRQDLFEQAGVDLDSAGTWPTFQQKCLEFQAYWAAHGQPSRKAIELYATQAEELVLMLLQRHINLVDDQGRIYLADPKVAETVAFYAQLIAGPNRITADTLPGSTFAYRDLAEGNICAMITPDWRCGYLKQYAPELSGKLRMRPLPIFEAGDAPTSTWGGTMIGIPRQAKDPQASWKLLEYLCLSRDAAMARQEHSLIIPPLRRFWSEPMYQSADAYFGGQHVEQLYISLADQIPARYMTPFSLTAQGALSLVLNRATTYVAEQGKEGLEDACAQWLVAASAELSPWVDEGDLEKSSPR